MAIDQQAMNKEALEAYRSRWQLVAQIEAEERQRTTIAKRLQQLNTLFQTAVALQIYEKAVEHNSRDAQLARTHWLQLKARLA